MEEHGEVCIQEEVERLWDSGMSEEEIARRMGIDPGWVSGVISMFAPKEARHDGGES